MKPSIWLGVPTTKGRKPRGKVKNSVEVDYETARRLFTLACVLHIRVDPDEREQRTVTDLLGAVLFACTENALRSPWRKASALSRAPDGVDSVGVRERSHLRLKFWTIGIDLSRHRSKKLRRFRGRVLRFDNHLVAGGATQGCRTDANDGDRHRILEYVRSEYCRGQSGHPPRGVPASAGPVA